MSTIVYYVVPFFLLTSLLELGALRKRPELAGYENRDTWTSRFPGIGNVIVAAHANRPSSTHDNLSTALRQLLTTPLPGVLFGAPLALLGFAPEIIATAHEISRIYPFGLHTERVGRLHPVDYGITKNLSRFNFVTVLFHEWLAIVRDLPSVESLSGALGLFFCAPGWRLDGSGATVADLRAERSPWGVVIVIEAHVRTCSFRRRPIKFTKETLI